MLDETKAAETEEQKETEGEDIEQNAGADESGDGSDEFESEVKKRGAKNVILENKRKADEILELQKKVLALEASLKLPETQEPQKKVDVIEVFGQTPKGAEYIKKMRDRGYDDDYIRDQLEMVAMTSQSISVETARPALEMKAERDMKSTLAQIAAKDPRYAFAVEKYGDKVIDTLREEGVAVAYWREPKVLEAMLSKIAFKNMALNTIEPKKRIIEEPASETGGSSGGGQDGVNEKELSEFAHKAGLEMRTKEDRAQARELFIKRKESKALYESKLGIT